MITNRLVADGRTLDLRGDIATPINLSIADILQPDKRARSFSKKIVLEGTQNNGDFFASAFSFTSSNNDITFDPTVKVEAQLFKGSMRVIDGVMQLNDVVLKDGKYQFTITLFTDVIDAFLLLKNTDISELDWTEYTHTLTQANIVATFTTPIGSGYKYKLMERGNNRPGAVIWRNTDLIPYVYFAEILDKILDFAQIPYTSTFISSTRFQSIMFGYGGGTVPSVSAQDLDDRLVDVDNGDYNYQKDTIPVIDQQGQYRSQFPSEDIDGTNFTETITQDTLGQYLDAEITCQVTGTYRLDLGLILDYVYDVGTMTYLFGRAPWVKLLKNGAEIDSTQYWAPVDSFLPTQSGTVDYTLSKTLNLQSGDQLQLRVEPWECTTDDFVDPVRLTISTNTPITIDLTSLDTALTDGSTIEVGRFIPNMSCAEFLLGAIRQFNLYISDPDDTGTVRIEPLTTFYKPTTDFDDITKLVDYAKDFKIEPSANLYAKTTSFKFKEIKDFDALEYATAWEEKYGDYIHTQGSYYAAGDQKIDLPWGTIVPYNLLNGVIVPRFISIDDTGTLKPSKGPARIMMDNGMKDGDWSLRNLTVPWNQTNRTTYPSVHHFDDYEAPEFDLNFKLVNELFYTTGAWVSINSYSEYHYEFINEITARSGTIITCYVRYNPLDIRNIDFSKLKMINGKLYRLNKVIDFDDNIQGTTKIELVKVLDAKNSRRIELFVPPRDGGVGVGTTTSPSGAGDDVGLTTGGTNGTGENTNLTVG